MIVYYDPAKKDWDEVLRQAWASRPAGETGTITAMPRGCRLSKISGHVSGVPRKDEIDAKLSQ